MDAELQAAEGFIAPDLRAEFPGLRLLWVTVEARARRSSHELERRLQVLSNRFRGASVIAMRTQPIPHAYRAFYRQIGLDPDVDRIPSEGAAVARLLEGGLRSQGVINDALLIALVETGVPVWALDADRVDAAGLGIRVATQGDRVGSGSDAPQVAPGRLVVADAACVHALLFGEVAPAHRPGAHCSRVALFAVGVDGVPGLHLEEALWLCTETLEEA